MRAAMSIGSIALILAASGNAFAAREPIKLDISWRVSIDAQGHVTNLVASGKSDADRVPVIREHLEQAIRNWRFIPGEIDGKPAASESGLHLTLLATQQDDSSARITITSAGTGASVRKAAPPEYPGNAVKRHETGLVLVRIAYDEHGDVTDVKTADNTPDSVASSLTESALKTAKRWKFEPERVGGIARAGAAITPVCFRLNDGMRMIGNCNWKPKANEDSVGEGQIVALNPATRLETQVVGSAL